MAVKFGDDKYVDRQIETSRARANRDITIEANGWKNELANTFKQMGLEVIKQGYLDRRQANAQAYQTAETADKRTYDEGVLGAANLREDAQLKDKTVLEAPQKKADLAKTESITTHNISSANRNDRYKSESRLDTGKMSDIDKKKYDRAAKTVDNTLATPAERNAARKEMYAIEDIYNRVTVAPKESLADMRKRKAAQGGGGNVMPQVVTPEADNRTSYQKDFSRQKEEAIVKVKDMEKTLNSQYTPENAKAALQRDIDALIKRYKL